MRQSDARLLVLAASAALYFLSFPAQALPERASNSAAEVLKKLEANAGGRIVSDNIPADAYTAVHAAGGTVLMSDNTRASPEQRARYFLSINGALAGITDSANQLKLSRISKDGAGNTHLHMDQYQSGLPVFGARLVVHMNNAGITGLNGVFLKELESLSTLPRLDARTLRKNALAAASKLHPKAKGLGVESSRLMLYNTGLLQSLPGSNRLAYEVMVSNGINPSIRERIILDANNGFVLNRINEIHSVLNRIIYTPTYGTNPPIYTEHQALPPAPSDPAFKGDVGGSTRAPNLTNPVLTNLPVDNLYIYAGGTWALYKNMFGRDGYDDGAVKNPPQKQESVYLVNEQCPNAYWNGTSTNYCPAFDADDVVSHEWSHAYTEYTHGLVYQYQSGALNESYSDIFGETYDLVNGIEGPLGITLTEGTTYDQGGSRWVVGEDLSEVAAILLLRDMWDPDNFPTPSPGSVISSPNYECGTSDNGGVHTNSGVSNHAYAMLVDGKTFNGVTVPKIGLIKAAHIYFQAETHYQTPTTNYPQHADALEQACADLIGQPLNNEFGLVSGQTINTADCSAVHAATLAVEFRGTPTQSIAQKCNYKPVLQPEATTPALCPAGKTPSPTFSIDWENGVIPGDWSQSHNLTGDTFPASHLWSVSSSLPAPHTGKAAFAINDTGGSCTAGGDQSSSYWLDSPDLPVPDNAAYLSFSHFMQSEAGYDGGQLRYSRNGGAFALVPAAAFTYNGHSGKFANAMTPTTPTGNNTNPNAGQLAWTGSDQGEATGSWGTTIVNVATLGGIAGDTIKFRWEFSNDGCGGNKGWYVDATELFVCASLPTPFTFADRSDVPTRAYIGSETVYLGGYAGLLPITVVNGQYSVNGGPFTVEAGQIAAGDMLALRHISSDAGNTLTETQVAVGGYSTTFRSLTKAKDRTPDAFSFGVLPKQPPGVLVASAIVTLTGFNTGISIKPGPGSSYRIDGGAYTTAEGVLQPGQTLQMQQTTSAASQSVVKTSLKVGGIVGTFTTKTR